MTRKELFEKIRADKNESLRDMAKSLNVSATYLSMVELEKKDMTIDLYEKITDIYQLTPSLLDELQMLVCDRIIKSIKNNKSILNKLKNELAE